MFKKRLFLVGVVFIAVLFTMGTLTFAGNLADVQKKIKEKGLKWVAEDVPNPKGRGLGLLKDEFTSATSPVATEEGIEAVTLPASLDWRNIGADNLLGVLPGNYVTPVKNQGSCGSCWAFATTATAESTTHVSLNDPVTTDTYGDYDLSEQDMLNCSGAGNCDQGGWISSASNYIVSTGLLQEYPAGCYAYNYSSTVCPNPSLFPSCDQNRYKIDSWSGVSQNVDAIKNALNMYGPLVTAYNVYHDFHAHYAGGIYEVTTCDDPINNPNVGGHAVSIVGYQDADATHPIGYFIVKNSWGNWGESGYFRIAYSQVNNCVSFGRSTEAYVKTACNGSIDVNSPTSSDTWQAGTSHAITWSAAGSIGQYVKIDLYQGSTFIKTIQASTPVVNGSYTWLVDSNLAGANYVIVVTSTVCGSASGASGYFTIDAAATFGASGLVTRSTDGTALSGVTMFFSRVSGTGIIPANVTTDGAGNWSQSGFQQGTTYKVTPSLTGYTFSPASSNFSANAPGLNFSGTPPVPATITVTAPNGGQRLKVGTTVNITWSYTGNVGTFAKIELLKNGVPSSTLTSKAKIANRSYSWRISTKQAAGSDYKIRITSTSNGSAQDSSDAHFEIYK